MDKTSDNQKLTNIPSVIFPCHNFPIGSEECKEEGTIKLRKDTVKFIEMIKAKNHNVKGN